MARPGGVRMAEGHRKQNVSRTWRASPSGISACFPENPPVVCSETIRAFMGSSAQIRQVCSALTANGSSAASDSGGRFRKGVLRKDPGRAWERTPGCFRVTGRLLPRGDDRMPGTRTTSAKRWKRIPAIGKNACAIYKRIRLIYTTHMGKNGRGSIRCRIGRAKPSPVGGERMRRWQLTSNRIFIQERN